METINKETGNDVQDLNIVEWNGEDDPAKPHNWPHRWKVLQTLVFVLMNYPPLFCASIYSTTVPTVGKEFQISPELATLGTSIFLIGNAFGPPLFGPLSEKYGRKFPAIISVAGLATFSIPEALARNVETIMVGRFLSGVCGVGIASVVGGALADIWSAKERAVAMTLSFGAGLLSFGTAPVVGSYVVVQSHLGWRWTMYLTIILSYAVAALALFTLKESFEPVLLADRAKRIRLETKNWAARAKSEEEEPGGIKRVFTVYILRPVVLLVTSPKLLFLSIYSAVVWVSFSCSSASFQ